MRCWAQKPIAFATPRIRRNLRLADRGLGAGALSGPAQVGHHSDRTLRVSAASPPARPRHTRDLENQFYRIEIHQLGTLEQCCNPLLEVRPVRSVVPANSSGQHRKAAFCWIINQCRPPTRKCMRFPPEELACDEGHCDQILRVYCQRRAYSSPVSI